MSVEYSLTKKITIGDLKKEGFNVEASNKKGCHPYAVVKDNSAVAISMLHAPSNDNTNEDDMIIDEFEGRFDCGGIDIIREICLKFNCMFYTDEDVEIAIYEANEKGTDILNISEEMYHNELERVGLRLDENGNVVEA